jgi:hypothetical protein
MRAGAHRIRSTIDNNVACVIRPANLEADWQRILPRAQACTDLRIITHDEITYTYKN